MSIINIEGESATVAEALRIGNLDWETKCSPIYTQDMREIPTHKQVHKSTGEHLSVQKNSYTPINNQEAFGIIDEVLGASHAQICTVGSKNNGNVCFIQAKMPNSIEVLKGDSMDMYLNGFTSHDGSLCSVVGFSAIRPACTNQFTAVYKETKAKRNVVIRHTKNYQQRLKLADQILMEGVKNWEIIKENAEILARKSVNREQTKKFINDLFPAPVGENKRDLNAKKRTVMNVLVEGGKGTEIKGVKGSAWGLFNSATEYFDHHENTRGETDMFTRSLLSGDKFRERAFNLAMSV